MIALSTGIEVKTELVGPYIEPMTRMNIEIFATEQGIDLSKKIIVIHPGSGGSAKDYPAQKLASVAQLLSEDDRYIIVITGTNEEKHPCGIISDKCKNAFNLCGKLSLKELIAFLSLTNVLIANSTGVLHIAASLGIAVVGLYPNTPHISGKRWGPYSSNSIVLNPPKDHTKNIDNMELILEKDVAVAAEKLLNSEGREFVR